MGAAGFATAYSVVRIRAFCDCCGRILQVAYPVVLIVFAVYLAHGWLIVPLNENLEFILEALA